MYSTFVTRDGCRIAYDISGREDAPVLLLSNSLGTSMSMWQEQLECLRSRFRVVRYDSRGHGSSDCPIGGYSLDRLGRDVVELLDQLDLETVRFCGLSLGGMVGQWLGIYAAERLERLVLANTSAYMGPPQGWQDRINTIMQLGMEHLIEATMERWFSCSFRQDCTESTIAIRETFLSTDPNGYAGCCAAIRDMDMRPVIPLIKSPTLIIGGSADPATPPEHSQLLNDGIANSQLSMLSAAHLSNVEQPRAFTRLVIDFLKE